MNSRCKRMLGPFSDITDSCHCKIAVYVCSRKKPCLHKGVVCVTCTTTRLLSFYLFLYSLWPWGKSVMGFQQSDDLTTTYSLQCDFHKGFFS